MNPTPTAVELAAWLGCLAFVVMLFNGLAKAWDTLRGKRQEISPQPLRVTLEQEFVRKDDCLSRHGESLRNIEEIKLDLKTMREARMEESRQSAMSRKAVYERIERVQVDLSRKIEEMPGQIVTQLLNSKQLWKG